MSTSTAAPIEVEPFVHVDADVVAVAPVSPNLVRITFGGPGVRDLTTCGPDQRIKVFLPRGGERPVVPTGPDWYSQYRGMADPERPVMRTYTVRALRPGEMDIDFVRHGDTGPASAWAGVATPGDPVVLWAPNAAFDHTGDGARTGADYAPPADAAWQLIVGDETALPAIGGIVEGLGTGQRVHVVLEVPDSADRQEWATEGDVDVTWLTRDVTDLAVADAVRALDLPDEPGYAWLAGEAGMIRSVRRYLVGERGMDRKRVYFCGYWRRGKAEDAPYDQSDAD